MRNKLFYLVLALCTALLFIDSALAIPMSEQIKQDTNFLRQHSIFAYTERFFLLRITYAAFLGCLIGITHDWRQKEHIAIGIGLKTYASVCIGSAAYAGINTQIFLLTDMGHPLANIGAITTGIGFLCGAVIFKEGINVKGLTTAATIWTTAAAGIAAGCGLMAIATTISIFVIVFHLLPRTEANIE